MLDPRDHRSQRRAKSCEKPDSRRRIKFIPAKLETYRRFINARIARYVRNLRVTPP